MKNWPLLELTALLTTFLLERRAVNGPSSADCLAPETDAASAAMGQAMRAKANFIFNEFLAKK